MTVQDLTERIGGRLIGGAVGAGAEIERVHAADKMSSLLNEASSDTLLVTTLATTQVVRLAELMDVPALCFPSQTALTPEFMAAAGRAGTALIHSPSDLRETCRRIRECLSGSQEPVTS